MGAEAKRYLQDHSIPQIFEGLMTGLIYNKPEDPISFLESAISRLRANPSLALKWDSFVEFCPEPEAYAASASSAAGGKAAPPKNTTAAAATAATDAADGVENDKISNTKKTKPRLGAQTSTTSPRVTRKTSQKRSTSPSAATSRSRQTSQQRDEKSHSKSNVQPSNADGSRHASHGRASRSNSLAIAADAAQISQNAPIILFIGGPGGGKTRYAARIRDEMSAKGLVHICMPDLVRQAVAKYKDGSAEWKLAADRYQRGELIPNTLAQDLVKAEMGKHPHANAYLLEGFPREARQVEDFEQKVRPINMAMILDYDEDVLRRHMQARGLTRDVIDRRIKEFTQKTLPSAKYFDDQRLLHLIPGEKSSNVIFERMRKLVTRAMEAGVAVQTTVNASSGTHTPVVSRPHTPNGEGASQSLITTAAVGAAAGEQKEESATKESSLASTPLAMSPVILTTESATSPLAHKIKKREEEFESSATGAAETPTPAAVSRQQSAAEKKTSTASTVSATAASLPPTANGSALKRLPTTIKSDTTQQQAMNNSTPTLAQSPTLRQLQQKELRASLGSAGSTKSDKITKISRTSHRTTTPESTRSANAAIVAKLVPEKAHDSPANFVRKSAAELMEEAQQSQSDALSSPLVEAPPNNLALISDNLESAPIELTQKDEDTTVVRAEEGSKENASKVPSPLPPPSPIGEIAAGTKTPTEDAAATAATVAAENEATKAADESYDRFPKGLPVDVPVILIIGAPGSNKSELAARIAQKYDGYEHVSMGALFRRKVRASGDADELWARIGRKMEAGEVIPMKICRELLYSTIHELGIACRGFVVEGYPRTLPQAEDLEAQLGRMDVAILIDCTEQYCKDTLHKRLQKSTEDGSLSQRNDDEESAVRQRMSFFKQNTLPMLKYLDDKGKLRVVRLSDKPHSQRQPQHRSVHFSTPAHHHSHLANDVNEIEGDTNLDNVFQDMIDAIDNALNAVTGRPVADNDSNSSKRSATNHPTADDNDD